MFVFEPGLGLHSGRICGILVRAPRAPVLGASRTTAERLIQPAVD